MPTDIAGPVPEDLDPLTVSQIQFERSRVDIADMKHGLIDFFEVPDEGPDEGPNEGPNDLRTAALVLAIRRVADDTLQRGIWP